MGEIVRKPRESCRGIDVRVPEGHLGHTAVAGEPSLAPRHNWIHSGTIFLPNMQALVGNPTTLAPLAIAAATIAAADAVPRLTGKPARRATIRR
jgi:hypothetical protein